MFKKMNIFSDNRISKIAMVGVVGLVFVGGIFFGAPEAQAALSTVLLLTGILAFAIFTIVNPPRAYFGRCGVLFCGKII